MFKRYWKGEGTETIACFEFPSIVKMCVAIHMIMLYEQVIVGHDTRDQVILQMVQVQATNHVHLLTVSKFSWNFVQQILFKYVFSF